MAVSVAVFDVGETGDRVDNDVAPVLTAGLRSVGARRGARAHVESPRGTTTVSSLAELPEVLARV